MVNKCKKLTIILVLLSTVITLCSCKPKDVEVYIFTDLSECQAIESDQFTNAQVTVYDSPSNDKYIKDLDYSNFYACNYSSAQMHFELFAYEFPDSETAQAYFRNATGQAGNKTVNYLISEGLFSQTHHRIVCSKNLAYSIYTNPSDADAVANYINHIFSEKITDA